MGFFGAETFRVIVADLPEGRKKDLQLDERSVGEFGFIDMRAMLRYREAFGPPAGEPTDLPGKPEFDGVDDAALAGPVRA